LTWRQTTEQALTLDDMMLGLAGGIDIDLGNRKSE
jgi:hypothetical protein